MKTKGLGAGLGALLGDAANANISADFEYVQIQKVEPRQEQPRTVFEKEKISELADSIREHGILSPLTVRRLEEGYFQIISGERRWRAAREAGLMEIPIRVVEADDKKALELALVENLQREDLNPIEEAQGYKSLISEFGMTQEQVATRMGKSRPAIANALRLLALPTVLVELVSNGELTVGSARTLLAIKNNDDMLMAAQLTIKDNLSVREVEALVKKLNKVIPIPQQRTPLDVDYFKEAQNLLTAALGRRVIIKPSREKGKIELEYYNQEDFNALFDTLSSLSNE